MGLLPAAMKTALQAQGSRVTVVLTISYPDGTTGRYAVVGGGSAARGLIRGQAESFDRLRRQVSLFTNTLSGLETRVTIVDLDQVFSKLAAKYRRQLKGSPATITWLLGPEHGSDADAFDAFVGVLDAYDRQGGGAGSLRWDLRLRSDDRALDKGEVPRRRVTESDYPDAHEDAIDQPIPQVFGEHSSVSTGDGGQLPTLYVDQVGFRYLVCQGWQDIPRVHKDAVNIDTGFSIEWETIGGLQVTLIDFTIDQGDAVITCDAAGETDSADGTGLVITNPADQALHFLNTRVFHDWRQGPYPAVSSTLDEASFAALATRLGTAVGAKWIGATGRAVDLIEEWGDSWQVKLYWKNDGKLAVYLLDHRPPSSLYGAELFRSGERALERAPVSFEGRDQLREVTASYIYSAAEGDFKRKLRTRDLEVTQVVTETREMAWAGSSL